MSILELKNVIKKYNDFEAVKGVSFTINEKEIFGLLGPNGAGKSTVISMICGLLNITEGEILFLGKSMKRANVKAKKQLGLVPQDIALYNNLSAFDNVKFFCSLYGYAGQQLEKRVNNALDYVGLLDKAKDLPSTFSGGMKRRLNIACAIAHTPELIILDEPTVGIDPQSRNHILESIKHLNKQGTTIIYTSHYMEEVEAICTRVGIMDHGNLIALGTKEELKNKVNDKNTYLVSINSANKINIDDITSIDGVIEAHLDNNDIRIDTYKDANNFDKIVSYLVINNIQVKNIQNQAPDLETVFMSLTGRTLRD